MRSVKRKAITRARESGKLDLNVNSPAQLKWALQFRGFDLTNYLGKESTEADVLSGLAQDDLGVQALLNYRKYSKLSQTYMPSYITLSHNNRIHASLNATGTRTGRISSSNPNLQNQPPEVRDCFISDPEYSFVIRDYSAIEPRMLAYYSEDPALLKCMLAGEDFHGMTAKAIFPYIKCSSSEIKMKYPNERGVAKTCGLAILYGAGANRLKKALYDKGFTDISEDDCRAIVDNIRELYAGVWEFKNILDEKYKQGDHIENFMGRPLSIEDPDEVYMKGLNTLIQSSASDLVLESMRRINEQIMTSRYPLQQCVLAIHDELIVQVHDDNLRDVTPIIENTMTNIETLGLSTGQRVPLLIEGETSKTWIK